MDTIFALSTAAGKAGLAVIRISGPDAFDAVEVLVGAIPPPRRACLRELRSADGEWLDEAIVIVFPSGQSFTGEKTVEIQCHGSFAVVNAILAELSRIAGFRAAEAGEFSRRALENDRLDLAQVEGLADLVDAETEAQRQQARRLLAGDLGRVAESWRADLIRAAALLEATIDFADEEVPVDVAPEVLDLTVRVRAGLSKEMSGVRVAERLRSGFEVAIVGAPNVGKSTLLNALAGREAALTSELAGTTRDVIEVRMDLSGLPVMFLDTAGIRDSEDALESMGIDRARERAEMSDLRVFLLDEGDSAGVAVKQDDIVLRPKADLRENPIAAISGLTGQGVPELVARITDVFRGRASSIGVATRLRHLDAMQRASLALEAAEKVLARRENHSDIAAEELRSAIRALDSLVGRIDIENVLDEIFSSFCIGK